MNTTQMNTTPTTPTTLPQTTLDAADKGNWRDAASTLIAHKIAAGLPFSSGEIAAELRAGRPDLPFGAMTLGDYIRDLFYTGGMDLYEDASGVIPPCQVPRTTQGIGRTPAGKQVFVYGPDPSVCLAHDFEVDIPLPPGVPSLPPGVSSPPWSMASKSIPMQVVAPSAPTPAKTPVSITGAFAPRALPNATVHTDNRLCVPRGAFEGYMLATNHVMRGGDPVYTRFEGNDLVISTTQLPGTAKYDLAKDRGRVLVTSPSAPFTPGDRYRIYIEHGELRVDISIPC